MKKEIFETNFGKSWRKYSKILRNTAPAVIESFKETSIEDNLVNWYGWAIPQKKESPINFLLRNEALSYEPTSKRQEIDFLTDRSCAKILWYTGKIPCLRRIMRLDGISVELFIDQETKGYIARENLIKGEGFGNDRLEIRFDNFGRGLDVEFDVGFTNKNGRNWFYNINVYGNELLSAAEKTNKIMQKAINNGV